jgi:hypothetical protein
VCVCVIVCVNTTKCQPVCRTRPTCVDQFGLFRHGGLRGRRGAVLSSGTKCFRLLAARTLHLPVFYFTTTNLYHELPLLNRAKCGDRRARSHSSRCRRSRGRHRRDKTSLRIPRSSSSSALPPPSWQAPRVHPPVSQHGVARTPQG